MSKSKDLDTAVLDAIKAGQIGRPVFVRCMVGVPEGREDQVKMFIDMVMHVQGWIGEAIERLYAVGTWGPGLSICVQFRNGGTAIIAGNSGRAWNADLIVLGNHGAIYHDGFDLDAARITRAFPENETRRILRQSLQTAVETGAVQTVTDGKP